MRKCQFKKIGPFSYFRVKVGVKNFLSVWLTEYENAQFGWEWGTDGSETNPAYCMRIGHFNVFSYEKYRKGGFILYFLGFWYMA